MGKIVYHGTHSEHPPHVYGETFHAGTIDAAYDRLADESMNGMMEEPTQRIHKYEISDNAPTSRRTWFDPMGGWEEDYNNEPIVPEYSQKRIYPYKNEREDRGSTSYVIPSNFVGNHVKHLGIQFQHFTSGGDKGHETAVDAMSTMVGGRPVNWAW